MRPFIFAALCLVSGTFAQAQTSSLPPAVADQQTAPALAVDEVVRIATQNNPRITAAIRDVTAAASGVRSARALTNPNAFLAPGVTSISGTGEEFLIQQPLEINGTRSARSGVAQAQLRATQAQAVLSLRDVTFTAKSAYYELARAREQATVARESLQVAQEFDRIARRQVEEGARPGLDLAQTGLEVSRAQRQVTLADGQVTASLAALNTVMGRDPSNPIGALKPLAVQPSDTSGAGNPSVSAPANAPLPNLSDLPNANSSTQPPLPTPASGAVDLGTAPLLNQALSSRSEILSGQATGDQFRQEARLARAEGRPDLVPQLRVGYFTRGLQPANSGNGAGIGIALTLPLLDYGSRRNRIKQAEQSAQAQDARVLAIQNEVRQEVTQALARKLSSESVVQAYQGGTLEQARILLEGSRVGFREGRTSVVALLEAQRSFRTVQNEYVNALADAAIARAEVERALGAVPASLLPSPSATVR